jgi:AraC-like DNA-binding protein
MPFSFAQLHSTEPTLRVRRLLWHVLSSGSVWRDEPEMHNGADKAGLFLFWVESGQGRLESAGRSFDLRVGSKLWLVDLQQQRRYLPSSDTRLTTFGVRFCGPMMATWKEVLGGTGQHSFEDHQLFAELQQRIRHVHELTTERPTGWEWKVHAGLDAVLGQLAASKQLFQHSEVTVPPAVHRVMEAVFAAPARDWQVAELASLAGVSYSRLRDLFKESQQETLHHFLQRVRQAEAERLLSNPELTIKEAAAMLDFSSEFYFSHFFRRVTGMTPTSYRRQKVG